MKKLMLSIKNLFIKKDRYFVEYKVDKIIYNFIVKSKSEDDALLNFKEIWTDSIQGVYPYPEYKIVSIKKVNNKIEI